MILDPAGAQNVSGPRFVNKHVQETHNICYLKSRICVQSNFNTIKSSNKIYFLTNFPPLQRENKVTNRIIVPAIISKFSSNTTYDKQIQ